MKSNFIIVGCGGHARSVADVLMHNDPDIALLFVDKNARKDEMIFGFDIIRDLPIDIDEIHFAIGDNVAREEMFRHVGLMAKEIISNTAHVAKSAQVSDGCFIGHNAYIGPEAKISANTIINTASVIEHEVFVGSFSHIAPNAVVCGRSKIGHNVFIGAGAVVKDKISICDNVVVGAGAVVVGNITAPGIYVGSPARILL